jgi:hypothetical protein
MNTQTVIPETQQARLTYNSSLRRILIVGHLCLLQECVDELLTTKQGLEVFHAEDGNPNGLASKVERIDPDVIILCHIEPDLQRRLIATLKNVPNLPDLTIIIVHLQSLELKIYQHKHWFLADQTAFFPLVYGARASAQRELV